MKRSVLEASFRHKLLLGLPIAICFLFATSAVLQFGRDYTASGSFWADTPPPEVSTNGTTGEGEGGPPSAGEATWLMQLLQTRAFMHDVVINSPLATKYAELDAVTGDRLLAAVAGDFTVTTPGPQLVTISVHRPDAAEATTLADSLLTEFEKAKARQSVSRANEDLAFNKRALDAAKLSAKSSRDTETIRRLSETQEAYDASAVNRAQAELTQLAVVDHPDTAHPAPRMQRLVMAAAGGGVAGMTMSIVLLLLILSRDTSVRNEKDAATAFGLPVVGSVPDAPAKGSRSWNPSNRLRQAEDPDRGWLAPKTAATIQGVSRIAQGEQR